MTTDQQRINLQKEIIALRGALNRISYTAHTCANGGLKTPGKPDRVSDLKRHMRNIRDIANEILVKTA
jgi:hypothetical protein